MLFDDGKLAIRVRIRRLFFAILRYAQFESEISPVISPHQNSSGKVLCLERLYGGTVTRNQSGLFRWRQRERIVFCWLWQPVHPDAETTSAGRPGVGKNPGNGLCRCRYCAERC